MLNSVDVVDVFILIFTKKLPTPKLTVGRQLYLGLLAYVFGIYSASTNGMIVYEYVASCLSHSTFETPLGRTRATRSICVVYSLIEFQRIAGLACIETQNII